jgi:hypothetical protein
VTYREQELVDQHRRWREQIAARPEQPWSPPERAELPAREQRLADARARRSDRLTARSTTAQPVFFDRNGVTLVIGPAPIMEQCWAAGLPVRVKGSNGSLYKVHLASITKPDQTGQVIGHPTGSLADRNRIVYLAAKREKAQRPTKGRRNLHGGKRGARSR